MTQPEVDNAAAHGKNNYQTLSRVDSHKINQQVAKWEDDVITGGSIVSSILNSKGDANNILTDVEGLSPRDWQLLHGSASGAQFKSDINQALNLVGSDSSLKSRVDKLLEEKASAPTFEISQQDKRSILDSDPKAVIGNILSMRTDEAKRYQNDPDFRHHVDGFVSSNLKGDEKAIAQSLLTQVAHTGKDADVNKLSNLDKVIYDDVSGVSSYQKLHDVQKLLADPAERGKFWEAYGKGIIGSGQDPVTARQTHNDPNLGSESVLSDKEKLVQKTIASAIADVVNKAPARGVSEPSALEHRLTENLFRTGKFLLVDEIRLGFPKVQIYEAAASASPDERKSALHFS